MCSPKPFSLSSGVNSKMHIFYFNNKKKKKKKNF